MVVASPLSSSPPLLNVISSSLDKKKRPPSLSIKVCVFFLSTSQSLPQFPGFLMPYNCAEGGIEKIYMSCLTINRHCSFQQIPRCVLLADIRKRHWEHREIKRGTRGYHRQKWRLLKRTTRWIKAKRYTAGRRLWMRSVVGFHFHTAPSSAVASSLWHVKTTT